MAVLVSVVWTVAAVDGAVTKDYTGLGIVTPVMMLVGAFLFAFQREESRRNGRNGNGHEEAGRRVSDDLSDF